MERVYPLRTVFVVCTLLSRVLLFVFFFQAEGGIRDAQESRGLGDVYKRQSLISATRPRSALYPVL